MNTEVLPQVRSGIEGKNGARSPALRAAVLLIRLLAETPAGTVYNLKP